MKLRPWTFDKDKEVVLKWIGNVAIKDKQWRIRAVFELDNQIKMIDFPIATLPLLRVGAFYKDGQLMDAKTTGIVYDVNIPQLNDYRVVSSIDACKDFKYYLYNMPELMFQHVFKFTVEGNTYYLPQFEFIRAVFTINKTITNSMMQPNGLELLVKKSYSNNYKAHLELANEIPNMVVKDDNFVRYFAWLYFSSEIKASFESIYTLLKIKESDKAYLKLEVELPNIVDTNIQFRGIQNGNKFLILQWLGSDLEGTTFSDIEVKHKAFKKKVAAPGERKYRKSFKQDEFENIFNDDINERSKQDANQQAEDITGTQFDFGNLANVHKVFGDEQGVNKGNIYISNQGQGGGIQKHQQQVVGLDESVYGGTIHPIEFKTLEVTTDIKGQGVEKFIKMIQSFQEEYRQYLVSLNLVYLPIGRKFSYITSSKRRVAVIAKFNDRSTGLSVYIIEIATPDNKSLSTLMIKSLPEDREEYVLNEILDGLIYSSGTWNSERLKKYDYVRIKHTKSNSIEWARRIKKYL
ncbi:Tn7-like element transposition protein TnsE [Bacillus altitudinis]|uniref:Tn7-like element transposition protein TnsE n=1 Tax=Bacillus altitudinis TaxID=293387 RepID=UPI00256FACA6|nr:Tn7-like element transposition protein TnsE [Bacillus altitudinis]WJE30604.1 Tn7-like element transposition protein TnsE [Bacillus altitudinis]